uniref:Histone-lysine N-methyltransferase CLF-like HTH domain-containing protein n=1 Tax=Ananas comosus var. bracteatus TaxID=296719 RepID=A0A6V7PAS3_ANACO|nr:unnamed protein product [Ananas comosus var. bracteatus]
MASKASSASASESASGSKSNPSAGLLLQVAGDKEGSDLEQNALSIIDTMKKQVIADRYTYIKKKIEENKQKLSTFTQHTYNLSQTRRNNTVNSTDIDVNLLTRRQDDALCTLNSLELSAGEKDSTSCQEESSYTSSVVLLGGNVGGKNAIRPIKLLEVAKLPPYTTWIFLDRNQRMTEDQSVVGRRRIYYDPNCGEALICSDSEDDVVDDEEEKKEYRDSDDYIIRMTIQESGLSDTVLDLLANVMRFKVFRNLVRLFPIRLVARYEILLKEKAEKCIKKEAEVDKKAGDAFLEKDLDAALDSFDNLFCRRCLVFDCRLHGCSQDLVFPTEKQLPWHNSDEDVPCGVHCYKVASKSENVGAMDSQVPRASEEPTNSSDSTKNEQSPKKKMQSSLLGRKSKSPQGDSASSNARVASESSESEVRPCQGLKSSPLSPSTSKGKLGGKGGIRKRSNKRIAERVLVSMRKRQKKMGTSNSDSIISGSFQPRAMKLRSDTRGGIKILNGFACEMVKESSATDDDESSQKEEFVGENTCKQEETGCNSWTVIEQGLFLKGLEMFGKNSCLISRNLLSGMKTCSEVFHYMNYIESKGACGVHNGSNSLAEGHVKGNDLRTRSRFFRRRGRVRRLKYTWKSAGYHSIRKRITERKDQPCRQYNPCGCQSACGKQCPCLLNGTCCEKYCAPRFARIAFEVAIVPRVSVEAANAHALLPTENAILMCAETVGLVVVMALWEAQSKRR